MPWIQFDGIENFVVGETIKIEYSSQFDRKKGIITSVDKLHVTNATVILYHSHGTEFEVGDSVCGECSGAFGFVKSVSPDHRILLAENVTVTEIERTLDE